jgi:type I restriction enzyme R subunit
MKFTEAQLESAIIELLEAEGYPHVLGEAIERQPQEVLIKADLRAFLAKQYAADHITPQEIEAVINQLEAYSAADLYESNKAIMKRVCDGFHLKREDHTQKDLYIQLIDTSQGVAGGKPASAPLLALAAEDRGVYAAGNNRFRLVSQLEIEGNEKRIPDAILYINGLPLVVFEFKSAIREEATIHNAYVQLTTRYRPRHPRAVEIQRLLRDQRRGEQHGVLLRPL